jgi:hypothetical protein
MKPNEIKDKITDWTKRKSNKSLPASAVVKIENIIKDLEAELAEENKKLLKNVADVPKNKTIPTEHKADVVSNVKKEAKEAISQEKKAVKAHSIAKTKPALERTKKALEVAKSRKQRVIEVVEKIAEKHKDKESYKEMIKRLIDTGKYDFLKGMSKKEVVDDMEREAKPKGWRFRGANNKQPTKAQIKEGKESGEVYYEGRAEHSDVSRKVKLEKGGSVDDRENKVSEVVLIMTKIQDKILNREKLTEKEKQLDQIQNSYGFYNGAQVAIKRKLI